MNLLNVYLQSMRIRNVKPLKERIKNVKLVLHKLALTFP